MREQLADRPPGPDGVADEVAADLVGDAGQGDQRLLHRLGQQASSSRSRPPGRPGRGPAASSPRRRICGHDERGVDPVEVAVRDDVRRDARARRGAAPAGTDRASAPWADGDVRAAPAPHALAGRRAACPSGGRRTRPRRRPRPPSSSRRRSKPSRRSLGARAPARAARLRAQRPASVPTSVGQDVERAGARAAEHRAPHRARRPRRTRRAPPYGAGGEDADRRADQREDERHPDEQGPLVVGAERRDREVLEPRRRPVDEGPADRDHRRRLAAGRR